MTIETIEKPAGSLKILIHIYRNNKTTITTLLKEANFNQRTAYSALNNLTDQKLIKMEVGSGFPIRKYYKLTEKGNTIASHLDLVDSLLNK